MPALATESYLEQFEEEGYVVVEDILDPEEDLQPVIAEYTNLLDTLAEKLYVEGKLSSPYRDLPFGRRLTQIVVETGRLYSQYFDISLPQANVKEDTPIHVGKAAFNILRNPRLLDIVETFIGPEIYSNPVQHVRIKPPESALPKDQWDGLASAVYWHQDSGVILPEADNSNILTVWIPVFDATEENGCLAVAPGSHKGDLLPHCPSSTMGTHIPEKYLPEPFIPVPVKQGGALFLTRKTVHVALKNHSDGIRWSFDLRYNPIGQPTGRPVFPGFIARSKAHPESALTDPEAWAQLWRDTRSRIARGQNPIYNRWSADSPACA
jgi:ectoine hydroxylase-related dioxygenase (phytanoyl-CoA dioxygenase family)